MRELAILSLVTLDGVMQSPKAPEEDPSGDFMLGGWAHAHWGPVMQQVAREAMAVPYDVVLGRTTYDVFADHASESHPMYKAKKYVVTSSPDSLTWHNSTAITGNIADEIRKLKQQDGPLLQVHGSSKLIQTLLAHELIDEFRIWTFPVVVGSGKRLFADGAVPERLQLRKSETGPTGVTMSIYRRVE